MENANVDVDAGFEDFVELTTAEQNNNGINPSDATDDATSDATGDDKEDAVTPYAPDFSEQNNNEIITLEDILREMLSQCSANFNVVHINAQSIPAHYLSMLATFVDLHNIDAVLVSETFLKDDMDLNVGEMPGFHLNRNDRAGKASGGVAIYLREDLHYEIVAKSPNDYTKSAEYLFIEVLFKETKILLGVFYSPSSKIDYFSTLEDILTKHRPKYKYVNVLGDFNTDIWKRNRRLKKLLSIIDTQNLDLLGLDSTHFAPASAASVLDLIIVNADANVAKHGQHGSYFSYHDLVYVSNKLNSCRERRPIVTVPCGSKDEPFYQKPKVRRALSEQLKALEIYKASDRGKDDLIAYQKSRENIKQLETEFKRENRKNIKQQ